VTTPLGSVRWPRGSAVSPAPTLILDGEVARFDEQLVSRFHLLHEVASVRAGEGPANIDMSDRRSLLVAALGFVLLANWRSVPELVTLHAWLDTWSGLGAIVVGMERHGFELWLAKDRNG